MALPVTRPTEGLLSGSRRVQFDLRGCPEVDCVKCRLSINVVSDVRDAKFNAFQPDGHLIGQRFVAPMTEVNPKRIAELGESAAAWVLLVLPLRAQPIG